MEPTSSTVPALTPKLLVEALRASGAAAPDAGLVRVDTRPIGNGLMADTLLLELTWVEGDLWSSLGSGEDSIH